MRYCSSAGVTKSYQMAMPGTGVQTVLSLVIPTTPSECLVIKLRRSSSLFLLALPAKFGLQLRPDSPALVLTTLNASFLCSLRKLAPAEQVRLLQPPRPLPPRFHRDGHLLLPGECPPWRAKLLLEHLRVRIRTSTTSSLTTGPTPVPSRPSQTSKSTPLPPKPTTTRSYPRPEPNTSQEGNDTAGLPAPIVKASRRGFSATKMIANWAGLQRSSSARGNSGGTWCGRLGGGGGISAISRGGSLVSPTPRNHLPQ